MLVAVLRSHGEASAAVAEAGLLAIRNLSCGNAANRTRLREAGACEGVWIVLACCVVFVFVFVGFQSTWLFFSSSDVTSSVWCAGDVPRVCPVLLDMWMIISV